MLLCTVRTCHLPLRREARRFVCERGHAFDIARSGYVNLLQPNERRSRAPGDTAAAVAARRRIAELAPMPPLFSGRQALLPVPPPRQARVPDLHSVLDVGCGDGYWLASIDAEERVGVDISVPAIEAAAKRYPSFFFVVANADRFLPFSDASFDAVISITARRNSSEFRRVLRDDGRLLVAVPAPDDLIELRGHGRDRVPRTIADFPDFTLLDHRRDTVRAFLDDDAIRDVLASAYRRTRDVEAREVTFSRDLLLFAPNSRGTPRDSSP